ncbi:hypothetical protein MKW94_018953 [Papaver nudicaule]|uniref:MADS-box domain-containing protein n=1 Tax=Papaver nudicaule TaxID=74823 RepID=A0AA41W395_PAPNU|nr:hypothetical protein [Papaver nudicaule]
MGRIKIAIEEIVDTKKKMVAFCKRRNGLMSKAEKLCKLCSDIVICIIVFSPAGRVHTFTNSPLGVCDIAERFVEEQAKDKSVHRSKNSTQRINKAGVGSGSDDDSYWWDNIDMEKLDSVEKLKEMRDTLANLKQNLIARKEKLTAAAAAASSPSSSSSSTIDDTTMEERTVEDGTANTEEHQTRVSSSEDHPILDLNLYLGWQ